MKEKELLKELISKAEEAGVDINSPEFKEKVNRAKEYISKRQDYLTQQKAMEGVIKTIKEEISKIKINPPKIPDIKVPEIKAPKVTVPEIKIPKITGLEELKKQLQKDLTIKGVDYIEEDLAKLSATTEKMLKYFDKPIPVVLISPITGKEYEAGGGGASYGGTYVEHLAKEDKQDDIIDAITDFDISTLATSAKQLPDNHQVTVSNPTDVSDLATSAKQDSIITELEKITTDITVDPFRGYGLYAVDSDDATYFYIMYQNTSGAWIVLRITLATGITLYSTGDSDASTNWGNRSSLTYADYENTFN
jgi:hypothetical protein